MEPKLHSLLVLRHRSCACYCKEDIKNINPSFLEKLKSSAQRITLQIVQKPEEKIVINAIQPAVAGDDYSIIYEDPKGDHSVGIYEKFTHKWRIKNTGTIPWENRYLTLQNKGEIRVKAIQDQFDIPALKPGDTAVVNVEMDSRYFEGTYTVIWEMKMSDGTLCFPNKEKEFSFDVTVKSDM